MARAATLKLPPRFAGRLTGAPLRGASVGDLAAGTAALRWAGEMPPGASAADLPSAPPLRSWRVAALTGRLAELSSGAAAAGLTLAFSLVLDAQQAGEPVGWLTADESAFFPPDAARGGVDLEALVVVRLPAADQLPRAAEHLARSGAFGLLVLDLGESARVPVPMQMRLLGLARQHESAVLFLTRGDSASLGSLVSLRAEARREPAARSGPANRARDAWTPVERARREPAARSGPAGAGAGSGVGDGAGTTTAADDWCVAGRGAGGGVFTCTVRVLKDKRGGPGWRHVEVCRGPDGLC